MPLVRVDIPAATSAAEAAALSQAVHGALVEHFTVPPDDLFQVISRRAPDEIVCTPEYLGVKHTPRVAFVQVFMAPGRTVGRKEAFYAQVAREAARTTGFLADDVLINLVETLRENWSFGGGVAHYAVMDRARPGAGS
jgi:phenylpyruvate tautomerase PptA (4-oxalocrotonate tautomerase family)